MPGIRAYSMILLRISGGRERYLKPIVFMFVIGEEWYLEGMIFGEERYLKKN